jgi:Na+-driven multidrug efflux pump
MYSIIHLSSPVILQNTLSMGSWFLFFVLIEHMGQHELAISNVVRATYMVLMTPLWGFAQATNSMVSNLIGQNRTGDVRRLVQRIITLAMMITVVAVIFSLIFPRMILSVVTSDEILISDSLSCFYIILGAMLILTVSVILLSTISGAGNTRAAMVIEFFNIVIYLLYVYLCTFVFDASIEVVWFSEILYWSLMGLFSAAYLRTGKWKNIKI